jgi:hypothetical protein
MVEEEEREQVLVDLTVVLEELQLVLVLVVAVELALHLVPLVVEERVV